MNKHDYYIIHRWMIDDLKLSGASLNIYAIIYGYTKDFNQFFKARRSYLASFTGISIRNTQRVLNKLVDLGLIIKNHKEDPSLEIENAIAEYKVNPDALEFLSGDNKSLGKNASSDNKSLDSDNKSLEPGQNDPTNNIYYNASYNINNNNNNKINYIDNAITFDGSKEDLCNFITQKFEQIKNDINNNNNAYFSFRNNVIWLKTSVLDVLKDKENYIKYFINACNRYNAQTHSNYNFINILSSRVVV